MARRNSRTIFTRVSHDMKLFEENRTKRLAAGQELEAPSERKCKALRAWDQLIQKSLDRFEDETGWKFDENADHIFAASVALSFYGPCKRGHPLKWGASALVQLDADFNEVKGLYPKLNCEKLCGILLKKPPYCEMRTGASEWRLSAKTLKRLLPKARAEAVKSRVIH